MQVPVVDIRIVRMPMHQQLVPVPVGVGLARRIIGTVGVLVMLALWAL